MPACLGPLQRPLGALEQRDAVVVRLQLGDAGRQADGRRRAPAAGGASVAWSAREEALARRSGPHSGRITANSSPPLRYARSSGRIVSRSSVGDLDEERVARELPEPVVRLLEVVEVEHADREPCARARWARATSSAERLVRALAVAEAR